VPLVDDAVRVGDGGVVDEDVDVILRRQQRADVALEHEVRLHGALDGLLDPRICATATSNERASAITSDNDSNITKCGWTIRSSARPTVGPLGAAPSIGARWASRAMSLTLVAPSAIATASDASTIPRSSSGDATFFSRAEDSPAVRPSWSAALRSRIAPAWRIAEAKGSLIR